MVWPPRCSGAESRTTARAGSTNGRMASAGLRARSAPPVRRAAPPACWRRDQRVPGSRPAARRRRAARAGRRGPRGAGPRHRPPSSSRAWVTTASRTSVDVGERRDRHADAVAARARTRLAPRAPRSGPGASPVSASIRRKVAAATTIPMTSTARATMTAAHGTGSDLVEHRVAEQREHGDDQRRHEHHRPAQARGRRGWGGAAGADDGRQERSKASVPRTCIAHGLARSIARRRGSGPRLAGRAPEREARQVPALVLDADRSCRSAGRDGRLAGRRGGDGGRSRHPRAGRRGRGRPARAARRRPGRERASTATPAPATGPRSSPRCRCRRARAGPGAPPRSTGPPGTGPGGGARPRRRRRGPRAGPGRAATSAGCSASARCSNSSTIGASKQTATDPGTSMTSRARAGGAAPALTRPVAVPRAVHPQVRPHLEAVVEPDQQVLALRLDGRSRSPRPGAPPADPARAPRRRSPSGRPGTGAGRRRCGRACRPRAPTRPRAGPSAPRRARPRAAAGRR